MSSCVQNKDEPSGMRRIFHSKADIRMGYAGGCVIFYNSLLHRQLEASLGQGKRNKYQMLVIYLLQEHKFCCKIIL
jgi:hypothetical protein